MALSLYLIMALYYSGGVKGVKDWGRGEERTLLRRELRALKCQRMCGKLLLAGMIIFDYSFCRSE